MRYLPLSPDEEKKILELCKVSSFEELTKSVPEALRLKRDLNIPKGKSEEELLEFFQAQANNISAAKMTSFQGQGAYDHYWPAAIDYLVSRGEFLTAYTPYQAELSQGTLQTIFEFQSMIAELFGMEISNASLYDGSTAALEGILMAARIQRKNSGTVLISEGCYDETLKLLKTYLEPLNFKIEIWKATKDGVSNAATLPQGSESPAAILLQSPNKWGLLEDWTEATQAAKLLESKSVAYVPECHILTEHKSPGEAGIDIATGEGQGLGIPVGFGGPYLGLICCSKKDVRQIPGRLVGATEDSNGNRAFCVTLATREQHIRREKATSNICSNQNLMALRTCIYLTLMGPEGLKAVSYRNRSKLHELQTGLNEAIQGKDEASLLEGTGFNEMSLVFKSPDAAEKIQRKLFNKKILAGCLNSAPENSKMKCALTLAVTERTSQEQISKLCAAIKELL